MYVITIYCNLIVVNPQWFIGKTQRIYYFYFFIFIHEFFFLPQVSFHLLNFINFVFLWTKCDIFRIFRMKKKNKINKNVKLIDYLLVTTVVIWNLILKNNKFVIKLNWNVLNKKEKTDVNQKITKENNLKTNPLKLKRTDFLNLN